MSILTGHNDAVGEWVSREVGKLWIRGAGTALGWLNDGKLIAGVTFTAFDGRTVWLDCAASPGTRWLDRRGLWAVFTYCFDQLGCERASAMIPEDNEKSRKLVEQAGFVQEASLKRAAPGGKSMCIYTLFRDDCRWLRRRN